ncbi:uncharacterized protein LOC108116079 [Drosophila eugracilis]|uniref:uncharacterized protein LOC108116079 n=1 Tax=Drosophila eugracilis TaxID=29029 RepID=UPI0007E68E04|nr:uncharacterized protein LOC108116079 [Drosophila eugracilis]
MDLKVISLLALLVILSHANGTKYELTFADEDIFSTCPDADPGALDIHGLVDISELSTSMGADGITIGGNTTLTWDIEAGDRIELSVTLLYLDRGTWIATAFSISSKDFCKVMYDKNQYWYKYWTSHIKNDVRDVCIKAPGTKMMYETYVLTLTANGLGALREGRYKVKINFKAFSANGVERPTSICMNIVGDLFKV